MRMATQTAASETWQTRLSHAMADQLRDDAKVLGLESRTEILKSALQLLHRRAAEERMARDIDEFYADHEPALPIGVRPRGTATRTDGAA